MKSHHARLERLERLLGRHQERPRLLRPIHIALVTARLTWPEEKDRLAAIIADKGPVVLTWDWRPARRGRDTVWRECRVGDMAQAEIALGDYRGEVDVQVTQGEEPLEFGQVRRKKGLLINFVREGARP